MPKIQLIFYRMLPPNGGTMFYTCLYVAHENLADSDPVIITYMV